MPKRKTWEESYRLAKEYYEEHGNLLVPKGDVYKNFELYKWLSNQKKSKHNNTLSKKSEKLLNEIGMIWDIYAYTWEHNFNLAKEYYETHGNLLIPHDYKIDDINLGLWIGTQRKKYKCNEMSNEQIKQLDSIEMIWDIEEYWWNIKYNYAKEYYKEHGNLLIPRVYIVDGIDIGKWLATLREFKRKDTILQYKLEQLEELDIIWDLRAKNGDKWKEYYDIALELYKSYGNLDIPKKYIIKGKDVGNWLTYQRQLFSMDKLSNEHLILLNKIDSSFTVKEEIQKKEIKKYDWQEMYDLAVEYYNNHNNLLVPYGYIVHDLPLGKWLSQKRIQYRKGTLSQTKIDALEKIGMVWNIYHYRWIQNYNKAKKYYETYGNLDVPYNYFVDGFNLYYWVSQQKKFKNNGSLSIEYQELLNKLDIIWNVYDDEWMQKYNVAKQYYELHGNLAVPCNYNAGFNLLSWLCTQRNALRSGKITKERENLLNEIEMIWSTAEYKWWEKYKLAKQYYEINGHLKIHRNYKIDGVNVYSWLQYQKNNKHNLSEDKIKKLEEIGIEWNDILKTEWNNTCKKYAYLKQKAILEKMFSSYLNSVDDFNSLEDARDIGESFVKTKLK